MKGPSFWHLWFVFALNVAMAIRNGLNGSWALAYFSAITAALLGGFTITMWFRLKRIMKAIRENERKPL